ncbi:MAG: sulfite exporter TauE/SafE family protein [Actinomycetia bacterium]|nr:sulfite exporter TauE/SafE family protein [Actinomycetes bacterium]MCP4962036.1 sulfite exporter TauE/SafE family protein [Actinomycetes bacterium]
MIWWQVLLLLGGGAFAGVINTIAGGGSTLTVPLLVLAGVPGNSANGSNRVGVLAQNATSAASFKRLGVDGLVHAIPVLAPVVAGSLTGSFLISRLTDDVFETVFGLLMVPIIILSVLKPKFDAEGDAWSRPVTYAVFFGIGCYGGAIQAGVGLVLLAALTRAGFDLVTANSIKVLVIFSVTAVALPVFVVQGKVDWLPALTLAVGFSAGGWVGAHLAVRGGERIIRVVMVMAALVLAAKLLGAFG